MTKSNIEKKEFWIFRVKRGYAIEITTRYYFTSTRLAKINKFDDWGYTYSRQNHPTPRIPHFHWQSQEGALKLQILRINPPFPHLSFLQLQQQTSIRAPRIPELREL